VLTFDLDFLAVARTEAPSVVIFRLRNQTPAAVNPRLFRVIGDCEGELASGAIIIVLTTVSLTTVSATDPNTRRAIHPVDTESVGSGSSDVAARPSIF
jgi:hypothetical protein